MYSVNTSKCNFLQDRNGSRKCVPNRNFIPYLASCTLPCCSSRYREKRSKCKAPASPSHSSLVKPWLVCRLRKLPHSTPAHSLGLIVIVQSLSSVWFFATPWTAARLSFLSFTFSQNLLRFMSIESVMPSNHLILCHPLLLLPSVFPSIRFFFNESALHIRWPKYWSFSFSISPSDEYSGLICFRIDWFDLFVVQGTLKSRLPHHNSKALILWCSAVFMVQLSHPYKTTGKTI